MQVTETHELKIMQNQASSRPERRLKSDKTNDKYPLTSRTCGRGTRFPGRRLQRIRMHVDASESEYG